MNYYTMALRMLLSNSWHATMTYVTDHCSEDGGEGRGRGGEIATTEDPRYFSRPKSKEINVVRDRGGSNLVPRPPQAFNNGSDLKPKPQLKAWGDLGTRLTGETRRPIVIVACLPLGHHVTTTQYLISTCGNDLLSGFLAPGLVPTDHVNSCSCVVKGSEVTCTCG